ncbi:hypothetical protein SESBI_28758 [Sesbania bispinosa]|nr:hypothetical protein SESBI_28758 [Sesbania bispinosa]
MATQPKISDFDKSKSDSVSVEISPFFIAAPWAKPRNLGPEFPNKVGEKKSPT